MQNGTKKSIFKEVVSLEIFRVEYLLPKVFLKKCLGSKRDLPPTHLWVDRVGGGSAKLTKN
jgi:hypothetical protein